MFLGFWVVSFLFSQGSLPVSMVISQQCVSISALADSLLAVLSFFSGYGF